MQHRWTFTCTEKSTVDSPEKKNFELPDGNIMPKVSVAEMACSRQVSSSRKHVQYVTPVSRVRRRDPQRNYRRLEICRHTFLAVSLELRVLSLSNTCSQDLCANVVLSCHTIGECMTKELAALAPSTLKIKVIDLME